MSESRNTESPGVRLGLRIFEAIASVPEPQRGAILAELVDAIGEFLHTQGAPTEDELSARRAVALGEVAEIDGFPLHRYPPTDDDLDAERYYNSEPDYRSEIAAENAGLRAAEYDEEAAREMHDQDWQYANEREVRECVVCGLPEGAVRFGWVGVCREGRHAYGVESI